MAEYVELHCHSNYSFQEGASSIRELVQCAVDLGYPALALTDTTISAVPWSSRAGQARRGYVPSPAPR